MPLLKITFQNPALNLLQEKGSRVIQVLTTKLSGLMFMLQSYVVANKLSGQVLNRRTGVLSGSIRAIPASLEGTLITGAVEGAGGAAFYGAVFEYGGNHPYEIVATKARALRFMADGKLVFAKNVIRNPAMARPFMSTSLQENAANINAELNAALGQVINE